MTRRLPILLALLACLLLGSTATAHAARSQMMLFDAQSELRNPDLRPRALADLESLGVGALRMVVYWKDVAPRASSKRRPRFDATDPAAYSWGEFDNAVAAAKQRGWKILMTLTTPAPKWATGDKDDYVTRPSAKEFGRFVTAAGKHWRDQVDMWAIGNEPNHPKFLLPQYARRGPTAPQIYRKLFVAADRALTRTGNGRDPLLIGETLPRGSSSAVPPITFLRGVLCLNARWKKRAGCARLNADGWSHHPYTTKVGPLFVPPSRNDVTIGSLSRLTAALDRAGRAGALRRGLPIYLTEFGIQSTPDRYLGVSLARQLEYRAIAERLAWSTPRVRAFSQYLLGDDAPFHDKRGAARYGRFESGLRFATGHRKPSFDAFRLPVAAQRKGARVSLWGMVRTATAPVPVEIIGKDKGKADRVLKTVTTDARGYVLTSVPYRSGRRYRIRSGGLTSPAVRSYRR
jgi:hypothetical protein